MKQLTNLRIQTLFVGMLMIISIGGTYAPAAAAVTAATAMTAVTVAEALEATGNVAAAAGLRAAAEVVPTPATGDGAPIAAAIDSVPKRKRVDEVVEARAAADEAATVIAVEVAAAVDTAATKALQVIEAADAKLAATLDVAAAPAVAAPAVRHLGATIIEAAKLAPITGGTAGATVTAGDRIALRIAKTTLEAIAEAAIRDRIILKTAVAKVAGVAAFKRVKVADEAEARATLVATLVAAARRVVKPNESSPLSQIPLNQVHALRLLCAFKKAAQQSAISTTVMIENDVLQARAVASFVNEFTKHLVTYSEPVVVQSLCEQVIKTISQNSAHIKTCIIELIGGKTGSCNLDMVYEPNNWTLVCKPCSQFGQTKIREANMTPIMQRETILRKVAPYIQASISVPQKLLGSMSRQYPTSAIAQLRSMIDSEPEGIMDPELATETPAVAVRIGPQFMPSFVPPGSDKSLHITIAEFDGISGQHQRGFAILRPNTQQRFMQAWEGGGRNVVKRTLKTVEASLFLGNRDPGISSWIYSRDSQIEFSRGRALFVLHRSNMADLIKATDEFIEDNPGADQVNAHVTIGTANMVQTEGIFQPLRPDLAQRLFGTNPYLLKSPIRQLYYPRRILYVHNKAPCRQQQLLQAVLCRLLDQTMIRDKVTVPKDASTLDIWAAIQQTLKKHSLEKIEYCNMLNEWRFQQKIGWDYLKCLRTLDPSATSPTYKRKASKPLFTSTS